MAAIDFTAFDGTAFDGEELEVLRRRRLPIWTCWIDVESEATGEVFRIHLATGLTKDGAWWAGRKAMDSRKDVISWKVRLDSAALSLSLQ